MGREARRRVLTVSPPVITGDTCALDLAGELDIDTCSVLDQALAPLLEDPRLQQLILDMASVTHLDSEGIRALLHARRTLHRRGATLHLRNPSRAVARALTLTRLAFFFESPPTSDDPDPQGGSYGETPD